ncbi:hypothetical protein [Neobacillus jeddahensis]|uniref:hypothetical protein n=1 Tax=Neobacillus jeddahensis TaxID=1461580 RepID=UPI00058CAEBC|nr:hypothetical protein [Neobacillus jeddahensis]
MRIRVVNSITDINGDQMPYDMIGKEYDVNKEDLRGVWVKEGKLDVLVHFDEMEIIELNDPLSNVLGHYLKSISKSKFQEDLRSMGCNHLL